MSAEILRHIFGMETRSFQKNLLFNLRFHLGIADGNSQTFTLIVLVFVWADSPHLLKSLKAGITN